MPNPSDFGTPTSLHARNTSDSETLYADELGVGAIVGNYIVEELRSRGGFATVYRAKHIAIGRVAALKVLHRELASSSSMLQRFRQEAQAVNLIRHPNIVDIYEFGELLDGRPYFVMEWLEGFDLDCAIRQHGAMPPSEVLAIMGDLCAALSAAHRCGVVHRDLKASNIFAVANGSWYTFKLLDFGIAKLLDATEAAQSNLTVTGSRVGTPTHMAPEQILSKTVDRRTDIYALGVLLYQLLTGQLPFDGATAAEIEEKHLHARSRPPSEIAAVPVAIDAVISRCLEKDPERRYQTVDELLADLRRTRDATARPARLATSTGIAVYFQAHIDVNAVAADLEDAVLDDLELTGDLAREAFLRAGLTALAEGTNSRIGVVLLPDDGAAARATRERVLRMAAGLGRELDRRGARTPLVQWSLLVHVGGAVVRDAGPDRSLVGGELLSPGTWFGEARPPNANGRVLVSLAALAGLEQIVEARPSGHASVVELIGLKQT
ncbi:MAG TPA: serine/threonine-protein kinase [Polyangia bacterium]